MHGWGAAHSLVHAGSETRYEAVGNVVCKSSGSDSQQQGELRRGGKKNLVCALALQLPLKVLSLVICSESTLSLWESCF